MPFYVHAEDRPGAGSGLLDLAEAHWSSMDSFGINWLVNITGAATQEPAAGS